MEEFIYPNVRPIISHPIKDSVDFRMATREKPVHYIQCMCSTAHTFGNVTAFIQNWLLNLFREGGLEFKTVHINSKIAHAQLRSTPREYLKKTPPMFIIRPRIDWGDSEVFMRGTPLIQRMWDQYSLHGGTNLQPFFQDDRNRVAIKWQLNRYAMTFDVVLIFETLMKQINWANYFLNAVRQNIPFNLETCLESYIAPDLLKQLAEFVDVPFMDKDGSTKEFLRYMNAHSIYPITYKLQGSNGKEEFYRYYPVNIDTCIQNFSTDEGERVGHVIDRYQISFTVRCEFNCTGFYYLFSDKIKNFHMITVDTKSSEIIPIFTDVLTKDDINLPLGWHLYASPSCRLDSEDDSVPIGSLLNDSIKTCLKFHKERGIPPVEFFKLRVRKQGKLLQEGKDYTFDYDNLTVNFKNASTYYTYKFIIMINVEYINNLVKSVYKLQ